ncbi:MAG: D-alanyl-D-alanine carboxypeptidase, partial [Actinobacteria bacterium]
LRTPAPSTQAPEVGAGSAVLVDLDTGQVLFELDRHERRPIASLTKIMTALLVVERAGLTDVVTVSEGAASGQVSGISGLGLEPGERIRVNELLYALLLQSANDAALALAEHVSGSVDAFVDAMNAREEQLGMTRTMFASPNGLDDSATRPRATSSGSRARPCGVEASRASSRPGSTRSSRWTPSRASSRTVTCCSGCTRGRSG